MLLYDFEYLLFCHIALLLGVIILVLVILFIVVVELVLLHLRLLVIDNFINDQCCQ